MRKSASEVLNTITSKHVLICPKCKSVGRKEHNQHFCPNQNCSIGLIEQPEEWELIPDAFDRYQQAVAISFVLNYGQVGFNYARYYLAVESIAKYKERAKDQKND